MGAEDRPFADVPATAGGHFVLSLYAAIFSLLHHVRRLADVGGSPLEQVLDRYGFLHRYLGEMRVRMPDGLTWGEGREWWRDRVTAWERECGEHLPLLALEQTAGLGFDGRLAFMLVGLVEEDSRFGTFFTEIQEPLTHRRPTLELVGQMLVDEPMVGTNDPWTLCRPLLAAGAIEAPNRQAPRAEWLLRVPPVLWDAARGQVDARPLPGCRHLPSPALRPLDELIHPAPLLERLAKLPLLVEGDKVRAIVLRSDPGADLAETLGAVAHAMGRGLLVIEGGDAADAETWRLVAPLATMAHAVIAAVHDLPPGETVDPPALPGYDGPLGLLLGLEGGLSSRAAERAVTLTLPSPPAELRRRHWTRALGDRADGALAPIVDRFHLSGGFIARLAEIATAHAGLDGREDVGLGDVLEASRTLNRQLLDTLAHRLEACGGWQDLVAGETTTEKLVELARRCRHRERLRDHLGPAFGGGTTRGVRALLTGPSGTGKTLAARILAAELGMDLYRVDLAAVVNKYIGETEKNLHRVLSRAEALDVVLLLDEGDALLGQRTEVKSANDRYANLETNYLLQRLETYEGVVLVTTNLGENIDPAFQRRMDVVVPFLPPQAEERWKILRLHLPADHAVDPPLLERVAVRCLLTGGQLRNAALYASLLALEEGEALEGRHLWLALRSEYRKAGGTFPLAEAPTHGAGRDGGLGALTAALAGGTATA